jgi:hypothetical protein
MYLLETLKDNMHKTDSTEDIMADLIAHYQYLFPNLIQCLIMYRLLPLTVNECERLFSQLNLTKTKLRSSMSDKSLKDILTIISFLENDESNTQGVITEAIIQWKQMRNREYSNPVLYEP